MSKLSFKAIVIGALVVLGLDVLSSVVLSAVFGGGFNSDGLADEQIEASIKSVSDSTPFLVASLVVGTLTTAIGGYVAGRIGKGYPIHNAAALGLIGTVLGIAFVGDSPLWFGAIAILTTLPASIVGGHFSRTGGQAATSRPM